MKLLPPLLLALALTLPASAQYSADWASLDQRPTPAWYDDAKFGIFLHWGVYSVPAWAPTDAETVYAQYAEWYQRRLREQTEAGSGPFPAFHRAVYGDLAYSDFADDFRAELFEPDRWAQLFKDAGARYVVLTAKHHDGFALWPSAESWNWNAADVGPHRDLAGDLTAAVRATGLRMGFYYSLYEWYNPLYLNDPARYVAEHMEPQLKDLVNRYEPDLVWADGEWDYPSDFWKSEAFLAWLFNESAVGGHVAVNDRWGQETRGRHGGFYTTEYGVVHAGQPLDDAAAHKWEETRGIGDSFGYNRAEDLDDYATSEELIELLVDVVSKGGNLLLNVGPTADGRIPVIMQQRLADIGDWLDVNGEAIYGTRPWTTPGEGNVRFTRNGDTLYAILLDWPGREVRLDLGVDLVDDATVTLLGHDQPLDWGQRRYVLTVEMPPLTVETVPSRHAHVLKLNRLERDE